eukprot:TRINITY_DN1970_c0_g1_i6.p1 TRINITY_DN1970_c0_g1~~TRINITY_DN1970_c0_g1_i6.p1  ORF type:complete len:343 (+),score=51.66 TRINITY_DN1970_c0_g1_i6:63-1091(+)
MNSVAPLGLWPFIACRLVIISWSAKLESEKDASATLPFASTSLSMHQLFANQSDSPNIMDVLARLPVAQIAMSAGESKRAKKVAVCASGHFRTFIEPGVHSALAKHAVQVGGASVDTYIVGHLGNYAATASAQTGLGYQAAHARALGSAQTPEIQSAINYAGLNTKKTHISMGDCPALQAAWQAGGVTGRSCRPNGNFMQMMWLDECVRMVRTSGVAYDLIVRTRPDMGVFQPVDYNALPLNQVSFMPKDGYPQFRADYFFAMPMSLVAAWWDSIANMYAGGEDSFPDLALFGDGAGMHETQFPAAIVRDASNVECFRLTDATLRLACQQTQNGHYFGGQVH